MGHSDEETANPVLGVRRSVLGQTWVERPFLPRIAQGIAERLDIPIIAGQLLAAKGCDLDNAEAFLAPQLRDLLPDPYVLKDMERATDRVVRALVKREKIVIFGDYDVDGATSSALLSRYFNAIGGNATTYIPDRIKEGYGPNTPALLQLHANGTDLVITVDCGTLSFEPLEAASKVGLDVIVIDHHKAETRLPPAIAIVNPNRVDDTSQGLSQLAAVGVAFLLMISVNRKLREMDYFSADKQEPNLLNLLDLVALGTVCDVVPLVGLNRAFVRQGLKVLAKRQNIGLAALADVGGVNEMPTPYHLGFILGPRVNAGGRVGEAGLGTALLTTHDWHHAREIAEKLNSYNNERKIIEQEVLQDALFQMEQKVGVDGCPDVLSFVTGEGWHPGVIGIVASRLKDKYQRPSVVIAINDGEAKGSCRSIAGVDIGAAIIEAQHNEVILQGGGHAMAAGLTANANQMDGLEQFLEKYMAHSVAENTLNRSLKIDGLLSVGGATPELMDAIDLIGPFGAGNATPRFAMADVTLVKVDRVGENHIRAIMKGRDGASIKVMAFRQADEVIGNTLLSGLGKQFHIVGRLKSDTWGAVPKVEMTLDDVAPA